ncbi:MAG: class I SAM-dependent methyltransferase [Rhizobiaceae bacterium]
MSDERTVSAYDDLAENYAKFIASDKHDPILDNFIKQLPVEGYVLDLGCGPAKDSAAMRLAGLQVDPVDASIEMVNLANKTYDIGARQGVFGDIEGRHIYDGIWANFSLLHASANAFPKHLNSLHEALKPTGLFHIGMKLGTGEIRDRLSRNYTYYSEDELLHHLTTAGFQAVDIARGEDLGLSGDVSPWIAVLSRT